MGEGEYGGNGSVHWYLKHGKGRHIKCNGKTDADGVDDDVDSGGYFNVVVQYVQPTDWSYDPDTKTLRAKTAIKHDPKIYTRQVRVSWP
jgi:hypothetical protein